MPDNPSSPLAALPAVDRLLAGEEARRLAAEFGRLETTQAIREILAAARAAHTRSGAAVPGPDALLAQISARLNERAAPSLRRVFNLTGVVLHTNLGRAPLAEAAVEAMVEAARGAGNLEYRIAEGKRGDRDEHVEEQLCRLTGAEAATVVNNNAAAVMLALNTFALRKEVPVSRGELIEIGGSFRMPEIMARAGCRLIEVGTTNRTHLSDYAEAIGPNTGMVMKVHTSNYVVEGFTAEAPEPALASLCREKRVPFAIDLGSGALVDLERFGLPHEPTPMEALRHGADLVTFSGDKLPGGPQAGIVVGAGETIAEIRKNPMKRALRCDKLTIAALSATLRLYSDPDRLAARLPVLRTLTRPLVEIATAARRLAPAVAAAAGDFAAVAVTECESSIGSGTLPTSRIPSAGLSLTPAGLSVDRLAAALRALPVPVIGRIRDGALILDFRCLEDEDGFAAQLNAIDFAR